MSREFVAGAALLVNLSSTWLLVGLVWTVQLVHYPLFSKVGPTNWNDFHLQHMKMITVIVAPAMLIEALSAAVLVFAARDFALPLKVCIWIAAALVLVNWVSTAGVQVPLHNQLGKSYDVAVIDRLVAGNWIRTLAWTARGLLLAYVGWKIWLRPANTTLSPNF